MLTIKQIRGLFDTHGHRAYTGEPVTQLEHALQSATLAQQSGAGAELICAALLHDLGHLINDQGDTPTQRGVDDLHQYYVLPFLRGLFPPAVLEPIRLHVDAKRYICATDSAYFLQLSDDSKRSLVLQGGVFSSEEARSFIEKPYAEDAVQLRRWDDKAKMKNMKTPAFGDFGSVMQACAIS